MKNFDYLKDISELSTLHRYCDAAERNQYADPDVSALNARRALEWIARAIFRMKNVEIPERTSLFEIVTSPTFTEFVNDDRLMMAVHYIRKLGNAGAHIGSVKRRESFFAVLNIYNFTGAVLQKLRVIDNLAPFDKELLPKAPTISIPTRDVDPELPKDFAVHVGPRQAGREAQQ